MTDLADLQQELEAAEAAVAEAESIHRRLESLGERRSDTGRQLLDARARLDDERKDVDALESFSPTRIWAALRGSHASDLEREQAEVRAAEYAVAELETRMKTLAADEASLADRAATLPGAIERRDRARAAKEAALTAAGGETGAELTRIAATLGETKAELNEVGEAFDAATLACQALQQAVTMLAKATDWADVDTFLGGGLLTDAIKYDRMDQANALLRDADAALARLDKELADLGRSGVPGPQVDGLTRTFDIWFDNLFTDWSVKRRIRDADERARRAFEEVRKVRQSLADRRTALEGTLHELQQHREELLRG